MHWAGLLDYHCPIPEGALSKGEGQGEELDEESLKMECAKLVKSHLTHQQVSSVLFAE